MIAYGEFAPTAMDPAGLGADDAAPGSWLVAPAATSRDAEVLDESNWHSQLCAIRKIDPGGDCHRVLRFGHWGPGWFEIVVVDPGAAELVAELEEIEAGLSEDPVIDDADFSRRETEAADEAWSRLSRGERVAVIRRHRGEFEFRSLSEILAAVRDGEYTGPAYALGI